MNLITVLLVDDDYLVLQDLKTLIDWSQLGFQIIGTASNGKKALAMFEKHQPQLIISDVSMPIMDGFDFIESIKVTHPDVKILIISSYADFQYAKRAIANGVEDYILKNEITKESLTHKLNKIAKSLDNTKQNVKRMLSLSLTNYFNSEEMVLSDNPEIKEIATVDPSLEPLLRKKYFYYIYTVQVPMEKLNLHFTRLEKEGKELAHYIDDLAVDIDQAAMILYLENFVIVGINISLSRELQKNVYQSTGKNLLHRLEEHFPEPIIGYYFADKLSITECKSLYRRFLPLLQFYSSFPTSRFMNINDFEDQNSIPTNQYFNYSYIQSSLNQPEDYYTKLKEYADLLFKNKDMNNLVLLFHNSILQFEELTNHTLQFQDPIYMNSETDYVQFFKNTYDLCLLANQNSSAKSYSSTMNKVIEYMKSNFADSNLTTEQIAAHVLLSSGRLSVLFKQETGKTLNDYLTDIRIKHAIYLLENTNFKIYEITEQVGYKSSQYFSQIFYQRTKKRPLDFRRNKN